MFFFASILSSVFYSTLPVQLLEYTVSTENSFRFQGISVSAFCLSCMTPCTGQDFALYLRTFASSLYRKSVDILLLLAMEKIIKTLPIPSICCYQAARRKGKFMTCNRHFAQNMLDHLPACRLHFSTFKVP